LRKTIFLRIKKSIFQPQAASYLAKNFIKKPDYCPWNHSLFILVYYDILLSRGDSMSDKYKTVLIRLEVEQYEQLRRMSFEQKISMSEIIRQAVQKILNEETAAK
jgi:hypothetical protein